MVKHGVGGKGPEMQTSKRKEGCAAQDPSGRPGAALEGDGEIGDELHREQGKPQNLTGLCGAGSREPGWVGCCVSKML